MTSYQGLQLGIPTQSGIPVLPTLSGLRGDFDSRYGLFQDAAGSTPAAADGDLVGLWKDQSGGARDASQASSGLRCTLKLNVINGLPAVQILAGKYVTGPAASNFIANNAYTVYAVFKANAIGTNVTTAGSIYTNHTIWQLGGGYGGLVMTSAGPDLRAYNYVPPEHTINKAMALSTWYAGYAQHAGGNLYVGLGNGSESSVASGNTGSLAGGFTIGAGAGGSADHYIARLLVYNTAHTPTEKASVMNYLRELYGITL